MIVALDKAGNTSQSVVVSATPAALLLASPRPGAKVVKPPTLRWAPVRSAQYFNVQLYRGGKKILSAWPTTTRLTLKARWSYDKRKYTLKPGTYTWYVWPGVGPRAAAVYGTLLGKSSFTVTKPRVWSSNQNDASRPGRDARVRCEHVPGARGFILIRFQVEPADISCARCRAVREVPDRERALAPGEAAPLPYGVSARTFGDGA